jgi:restriction system protein
MDVPTYDKFIEPLLRYMAQQNGPLAAAAAHNAVADALGLDAAQREILVPSGQQLVYKNRCGWAHDRLKRAGLSSSPKHGYWELTPSGREFVESHPGPLPPAEVERLATSFSGVRLRPPIQVDVLTEPNGTAVEVDLAGPSSPDERLDHALAEIRNSVARELLESIGRASPKYFESIVLDVLHSMGYGAKRSDLQRVGGSGDAGIDGVISLDRLGLEKVYVQAKRWQGVVGRPDVQGFYGALAGQRANKGVFITTSGYTKQAIDFAASVERIVLIDGEQLAQLMIEYEVGVSSRAIRLPRVDSDYFEE